MIYTGISGVITFSDDPLINRILGHMCHRLKHRGEPCTIHLGNNHYGYYIKTTEFIGGLTQYALFFDKATFSRLNIGEYKCALLDGKIYDPTNIPLYNTDPQSCTGYYTLAIFDEKKSQLEIYRDFLGRRPLFYGFENNIFVFGSERKAFKKFFKPKRLPPGHRLILSHDGLTLEEFKVLRPASPDKELSDIHFCSTKLAELLYDSVSKSLNTSTAIMFSGGLDSSTIARIASEIGDVELFSIGMVNSRDIKWSKMTADLLGLDIRIRVIHPSELEDYLLKTMIAIESSDPLQVLIGVPIYIVSEFIHDSGYNVALAGQGADELFGGYAKYLRMSKEQLCESLFQDVYNISIQNLERDNHIAMANSIDLRTPYLSDDIVNFALRIPVELKVYSGIRKYILRVTADKIGVPKEIVYADKKAIQYSTGISKHFEKAAKKHGMTLQEFFNHIYAKA